MIKGSQADKIRELALELLKESEENEVISRESTIKGIRYNNLKTMLLNFKIGETHFTEGAIVGALNNLEKKVLNVNKIRTEKGVYFYYANDNKSNGNLNTGNIIPNTPEYQELKVKSDQLNIKATEILKRASQTSHYNKTTSLDIKYLRRIIEDITKLTNILDEYETEKSFELLNNKDKELFDDLPF